MIPTVTVSTNIFYNDNTPAEGVKVRALLQSPSQYSDGYIVQKPVEAFVDELGYVELELWPNENGTQDTFYVIEAVDSKLEELLNVVAVVPESATPLELEDIALPMKTLSLGQSSGNVASIRRINTAEGIIGGGDLSQNREHRIDLTTITSERISPTLSDIIAIQDPTQPDAVQWVKIGDLPGLNYPVQERTYAITGQTVILIDEDFIPNTGQIQLSINGRDVYSGDWIETEGQIELDIVGGLEGGEEILVTVLKAASFGAGGSLDSTDIAYGTGTVQDALDELYSTTESSPWAPIVGDVSLLAGNRIFADPTSAPITLTLPATPVVGTSVKITEASQSSNIVGSDLINPITVDRNGELIMDLPDNLIIDQALVSVELVYMSPSRGWRLLE